MVQTCYICKWRADKEPRRSFHKFPYDEAEKQKWLDIIGKSHVSLGKRTSVCSIHFDTSCFRYGLVNGRELLRQGSVPTLQLTRPPEVDPYEDLYNMHKVEEIEIKIEPDSPEDWEKPPDIHTDMEELPSADGVTIDCIPSEMKTEVEAPAIPVTVEIPQTSNKRRSKQKKEVENIKLVNMDISKRKEFTKKQALVRMLVERLRRDHVKLKNYIQTLEEQQKTVRRRRKKKEV
ncbi:THAP domain-containing protein 1 [Bicyclus anynana]|uniref:THAP domain-containing protein 1 n=1 Tax=Bicyclus anynana TaxID=110368 RepID=A0A6J1N6R8_BICAN|nr:THAP domain-containing protein 1 [Bicyclus anynana]